LSRSHPRRTPGQRPGACGGRADGFGIRIGSECGTLRGVQSRGGLGPLRDQVTLAVGGRVGGEVGFLLEVPALPVLLRPQPACPAVAIIAAITCRPEPTAIANGHRTTKSFHDGDAVQTIPEPPVVGSASES